MREYCENDRENEGERDERERGRGRKREMVGILTHAGWMEGRGGCAVG